MARYYRRRYRTIVRAPKKKWGSNIRQYSGGTEGSATQQYAVQDLVVNSASSATPTPVILKTGNFKIQGDYRIAATTGGGYVGVSLYVIYVPEGVVVNSYVAAHLIITNHPEWIMAWKFLSSDKTSGTGEENSDSFSFSSRLKRNLNSGDTIRLITLVEGTNIDHVMLHCMAQYWTCAN